MRQVTKGSVCIPCIIHDALQAGCMIHQSVIHVLHAIQKSSQTLLNELIACSEGRYCTVMEVKPKTEDIYDELNSQLVRQCSRKEWTISMTMLTTAQDCSWLACQLIHISDEYISGIALDIAKSSCVSRTCRPLTNFQRRLCSVHLDAGLFTGVHHQAKDVASVLQHAAS